MKAYKALLITEIKCSFRGMDMPIFALIMPLIVLVVLGMIYGDKPAYDGADYTFMQQSFGALTTISICAGGVMGLPLIIADYRSKKLLKRLQVTPVRPIVFLLAMVSVYVLYALASLGSLVLVGKLIFGIACKGNAFVFLGGWFLVLCSMFSIGMMVGGIAKNSKIAGVIASILYFPMLLFSGATLPYEVMPKMMQSGMEILPLTQGVRILKAATLGLAIDNVLGSVLIMLILLIGCSFVAIRYFHWE